MANERGSPYRIILENVQGPTSYPPGGFITGGSIGSNIAVGTGASNLGGLRVVVDAMGQGIALASGVAMNSGYTSGIHYVVQSAGISGNQIGIRCFNPTTVGSGAGIGGGSISQSGGSQVIQEVQSGSTLDMYNFKVLVQGY
jgi:hypothetical protein